MIYSILLIIHIISAVIWIGYLPSEIFLIKTINSLKDSTIKKIFILKFLRITNLTGMLGAIGILLTGTLLVIYSSYYKFFELTANHWLTTKQIIMIIILLFTFFYLIPAAKKLRVKLTSELQLNENEIENSLKKFFNYCYIEKSLVLINFLLAITHKYL